MAGSGAHSIAVDECMSLAYVGEIAREYHVGFLGNFHVTAALFEETEEAMADVQRCIHEGKRFPGYVFGLGGPLNQHINPSRLDAAITTLFAQGRHAQSSDDLDADTQDSGKFRLPESPVIESKEER
jgi:Uroporphyrinogen decarboxylase (URO-D)